MPTDGGGRVALRLLSFHHKARQKNGSFDGEKVEQFDGQHDGASNNGGGNSSHQ